MKNLKVRINSIELCNVKNVENGSIFLNEVDEDSFGASIVGIYGQNGSGKTALIWACSLIKSAISGEKLPDDTYYYIRQNAKLAEIKVEFAMSIDGREYTVIYSIKLIKSENSTVQIDTETIDYSSKSFENKPKINKTKILGIEYPAGTNEIDRCFYQPETRLNEMSARDKQIRQKLTVLQALAKEKTMSFIFNDKVMKLLETAFSDEVYYKIINSLLFYGRMNLFVLNKNFESTFNMNLLPLSMRFANETFIAKADSIPIGLGLNQVDEKTFETVEKIIQQIDVLLGSIIPNLNVDILKRPSELNENGKEQIAFELVSNRNGVITPLRYESEGIKKILCLLSSLIAMYNDQSVFVAIDEMDAGIFEYLLGEILNTIRKTGKGQLLFTSHNMRPLEVLENKNIYFTTTNPTNKYIQFRGIKNNSNLRSTLLRTIDLGGQRESIYENTSEYEISKAFRKAGRI